MKSKKYIYVFRIYKKPKAIEADSIDEAMTKIVDSRFWSMFGRTTYLLLSNDPDVSEYPYEIDYEGGFFKGGFRLSETSINRK